jgi:hypothetical protein
MFQPRTGSNPGTTQQFLLGLSAANFRIDALYSNKNDAIVASPLTAAQTTTLATACASAPVAGFACAPLQKALSGTIADLTATAVLARIAVSPGLTAFAGLEALEYRNPSSPVSAGQPIIGDYVLVTVNNSAFPSPKKLRVYWAGLKYVLSDRIELSGAYYRYHQNAYAVGPEAGCDSAAVSVQCSGALDALGALAIAHWSRHVDLYAGSLWSQIEGGPANGYLARTAFSPTLGLRHAF